ncbi:MAG: peptide deformylase [Myxococcota bacterium]|nr:peptide deformylase [Myxococcota bacterium]MEE2779563.1 peptide deformylase [Myxococcota bacterium]
MAVRNVVKVGHPALRSPTRDVSREELASENVQGFIDDLIETMRDANGAGLAANQVGDDRRICVIQVQENPRYPYKPNIPLTVLVNPRITLLGEERFENYEGCLSVPDLRGVVPRAVRIRLQALDRDGSPIDREVVGLTAGTFQHECDHLDGLLFLDRVEDTTTLTTWDGYHRFHKEAFEPRARALVARFGS